MADHYDWMTNAELEQLMRARGLGDKVQWFPNAVAKAEYLRDWDYDAEVRESRAPHQTP